MSSSLTARFSIVSPIKQSTGKAGTSVETLENAIESTDETILERIREGDRDALALLFRRYARAVRNVGQRILRDRAEADDLVQEVFLYIHRKSTLFDSSKGSARSWIIQVAYTQALLRRRQLKSHGFYVSGITDKLVECRLLSDGGADYDRS